MYDSYYRNYRVYIHKIVRQIAQLAIIPIGISTNAIALDNSYSGLNYAYSYCALQQGYGGDIFTAKNLPEFYIFANHYFKQLIGFEIGYARTCARGNEIRLDSGFAQFGIQNFTSVASAVYATKQNLKRINLLYVPQFRIKTFTIVPMFGVAYVQVKQAMKLLDFDGVRATPQEQDEYQLNFGANKFVPTFGVRLQYFLTQHTGLYGAISFAKTSLMQLQARRQIFPSQELIARLHDTYTYGLGLVVRF